MGIHYCLPKKIVSVKKKDRRYGSRYGSIYFQHLIQMFTEFFLFTVIAPWHHSIIRIYLTVFYEAVALLNLLLA